MGADALAALEQAANGLMMGAIYALFAVGLVLIFGIMRVLNFAHGILFMAGAYACDLFFTQVVHSYVVAVLLSMLVMAALGMLLERGIFRRLRNSLDMQIVASLGLILVGQNAVIALFGPTALQMRVPGLDAALHLGPLRFTTQHALIIAVVAVAIIGLTLFLDRTRIGTAMRATSQSVEAARVVGIDPDRMFLLTFAIASALAALGGALIGPLFLVFPQMGDLPLLKALTAIVLGGMGSVPGALIGGLGIGFLEAESTLVVPTDYRDLLVFAVLIAVLLLRPRGLFGAPVRGEA